MVAGLLGSGLTHLGGGSVPRNLIQPDAKWMLHLDVEALRKTELYQYLDQKHQLTNIFECSIAFDEENFDLDIARCDSLTCSGTTLEFDDGEASGLIRLPAAYRSEVLNSLDKLTKGEDAPLKAMAEKKAWHGYQMEDEVCIYSPKNDLLVFGSQSNADQIAKLAVGKGATQGPRFLANLPVKAGPFLLLAYDGDGQDLSQTPIAFNLNVSLPPGATNAITNLMEFVQAQVFQRVEGGSLVLGESTNWLWASLSLKAKSPADATQARQALDRVLGFIKLLPTTNTYRATILRGITITARQRLVNLSFAQPTKLDGRGIYDILQIETPPLASRPEPGDGGPATK